MAMADGQMGIHVREKHIVLGLDPGRDKTGFAFVDGEGELMVSGIFPSGESDRFFAAVKSIFCGAEAVTSHNPHGDAMNSHTDAMNLHTDALSKWIIEGASHALPVIPDSIAFIAIGNGTHSKPFTANVRAALPYEVLTVDETNTTLEARTLYWKLHSPNFWVRLIPEGLRVPARVLDDLAAWAIAVRGLKKYRDINQNRL